VLARVPDDGRARESGVITPDKLSPAAADAHRALRATLAAAADRRALDLPAAEGEGRAVVITGSTAGEGRSSTALNLAAALVHAGTKVILIEADLRRPALAKSLGVDTGRGLAAVLTGESSLRDALVETPGYGDNLRILPAGEPHGWMADQLSMPAGRALVQEARRLADFVIIDSPPIPEVVDPLPLIESADDVVIVTRIGKTHIGRLEHLGELLEQAGVTPVGIVVIGTKNGTGTRYGVAWGRLAPSSRRSSAGEPLVRAS
jgi:capsular exopolysaccharide synthesis family protein